MNEANETGRLRWSCRRGMRELDVLLLRYLDERFVAADAAERSAFRELLQLPDPVIAGYILAAQPPADPALARLVARITRDRT